MKKALITGIAGQDGFFLSRLLAKKDYEIHGLIRKNKDKGIGNLKYHDKNTMDKIKIHYGSIEDREFVMKLIKKGGYDEIYHLAAQSSVAASFENPKYTYEVNINGTLNILDAIKEHSPKSRLYFAATSELFGKVKHSPQNENTPFYPRSPYGISKLVGFLTIKSYRESYKLFLTNGIVFNHESEIRGREYVTRKITSTIARIHKGEDIVLTLGNLEAKRDWGYAGDFVKGIWEMMQLDKPGDFILATHQMHSVKEFVEAGFKAIGIEIMWKGSGVNQIGLDKKTRKVLVKVDPKFFRPAEIDMVMGDYSKARRIFGWTPKIKFEGLVKRMVDFDIRLLEDKETKF